jgi:hypothetical protein
MLTENAGHLLDGVIAIISSLGGIRSVCLVNIIEFALQFELIGRNSVPV